MNFNNINCRFRNDVVSRAFQCTMERNEILLGETEKVDSDHHHHRSSKISTKQSNPMDPLHWHKVAAISGAMAVGLGAYGAHMFKPKNLAYKEVWQTAATYHLAHTVALLAAPITKRPNVFGGLLTAGIITFSGTCYAVAVLEDRKYSALAPFGGFAFIAAWASLLF